MEGRVILSHTIHLGSSTAVSTATSWTLDEFELHAMMLALRNVLAVGIRAHAFPTDAAWKDLPDDVRGECRGRMSLLTRMTLAMTCRDEHARIKAAVKEEPWMAEGYRTIRSLTRNDDLIIQRYRTLDNAGLLTRARYAQLMPLECGYYWMEIKVLLPIRHVSDDCLPQCKCKVRGTCRIYPIETSTKWWKLEFLHPDIGKWSPGMLYANPAHLLPIVDLVRAACLWTELKAKDLTELARPLIDAS